MAWVRLLNEPSADGLDGYVKTKAELEDLLREYELSTNSHFIKKNCNIFSETDGKYIIHDALDMYKVIDIYMYVHRLSL